MNYVEKLEAAAATNPAKVAIIWDDPDGPPVEVTYAELIADISRFANALRRLEVRPGDRVALMLNNRPEFPAVYYACGKIGATVVLVNTLLKKDEIDYILKDASCRFLVTNAKGCEEAAALFAGGADGVGLAIAPRSRIISVDPVDDTLYYRDLIEAEEPVAPSYDAEPDEVPEIKYTSGTTGHPKGVMHTHRNIVRFTEMLESVFPAEDNDRVLCFMPLYHGFGDMSMLHPTLFGGGTIILQDPFDPNRVLAAVERHRATIMGAVPAVFWVLLNTPGAEKYDISSLRYVMSGGQSIPEETLNEFEKRFGCTVYEGYGLTESTAGSASGLPGMPRKIGSVGVPLPGVEVRIADVSGPDAGHTNTPAAPGARGEVLLRTELNMLGYLGKPAETAEVLDADGWLHTGDIGYLDEDGYLFIVDRLKEMIIMTGENIYPSELENVIAQHPAVAQVAVVGAPDPRRGQVPKAVVTLRPGTSLGDGDLESWCKERMAPFKVPRIVEVRESLPLTPSGKIAKKEL